MRVSTFGLVGLVALLSAASAQAGDQCYRRVIEPAQYRTVEERVLIAPERRVAEYVPAVTRQVEETIVVRPAHEVARVSPALYRIEEESVLVRPARREWRLREHYGEIIGCWVKIPAIHAWRAYRVLVSPERVYTETVPAVTATRWRSEVVEPAHAVARVIPARYGVHERAELVAPASAHWAPTSDFCEGARAAY
jgi:hypothetical protein